MNGADDTADDGAYAAYEDAPPRQRVRAPQRPVTMGTVAAFSAAAALGGATLGALAPRLTGGALDAVAPDALTGARRDLAAIRADLAGAKGAGALPSRTELDSLRASLASMEKKLALYEEGLLLLNGGPAEFETLRRRLAALEAVDDPTRTSPVQLARGVAGLQARMDTVERNTSKSLAFEAAGAFGDPAQMVSRITGLATDVKGLQEKMAAVANQKDLEAVTTQVASLQTNLEKVAQDADRAVKAAASAYAVAAATEAVRSSGPFEAAYASLSALLPEDPNVKALAPYAKTGAPTPAELKDDFRKHDLEIIRAARIAEAGPGLMGQFQAWLAQFIVVRNTRTGGATQSDVVNAMRARVEAEDLAGALAEGKKLKGRPAQVAAPWLAKAQARLTIDEKLAAIRAELSRGSST